MNSDEQRTATDLPKSDSSDVHHRWQDRVVAPLSKTARIMLLLGGVILPVLCHLFALDGVPVNGANWQSGALYDRISFILTMRAGFVFYPFMGFSMAALVAYLFYGRKVQQAFWVPLGIVNGVLVSLWYTGVFAIVLNKQISFDPMSTLMSAATFALLSMIPIVAWLMFTAIKWVCRKMGLPAFWGGIAFFLLYTAAFSVAGVVSNGIDQLFESFWQAILTPIVLGVVFAPIWSLTAYALTAVRLFALDRTASQFSLIQLMGLVTYAAGLITACRTSVWLSLVAYSELPTVQPSGCYVATAASHGHRFIVGTHKQSELDHNRPFPVNRQLQVLKAFEIALRTLSPVGHRYLRRIYDLIGPSLAKRIDQPWKADIAFLLLKPFEWLTNVALAILLGRRSCIVECLYVAPAYRKQHQDNQ